MKRFRFTLIAVCLVLLWLGYNDLSLFLRNPEPQQIALGELETGEPPREWLTINGGFINLAEAINMTGTLEIDALLVPLTTVPGGDAHRVFFETRDPQLLDLWKTYHFKLDSALEQERFFAENERAFFAPKSLTGMTARSTVAGNNRGKLQDLAQKVGMNIDDNAIFISEGKEPGKWRGFFFIAVALLGLLKTLFFFGGDRKEKNTAATDDNA